MLETLKGQKTLAQLSTEFSLHANQISEWKKQALSGFPSFFSGQKRAITEEETDFLTAPLYQQIGQLKVEVDFLKKSYARVYRTIYHKKKNTYRAKLQDFKYRKAM